MEHEIVICTVSLLLNIWLHVTFAPPCIVSIVDYLNMSTEHGPKFAERVKRKNSENNLSQRGFVHYKCHTE